MVSPAAAAKLTTHESPFMKIGSKIKNMFGNFFKEEATNRSYEEARNLESYHAEKDETNGLGHRSKSIYHSVAPSGDGDILILENL